MRCSQTNPFPTRHWVFYVFVVCLVLTVAECFTTNLVALYFLREVTLPVFSCQCFHIIVWLPWHELSQFEADFRIILVARRDFLRQPERIPADQKHRLRFCPAGTARDQLQPEIAPPGAAEIYPYSDATVGETAKTGHEIGRHRFRVDNKSEIGDCDWFSEISCSPSLHYDAKRSAAILYAYLCITCPVLSCIFCINTTTTFSSKVLPCCYCWPNDPYIILTMDSSYPRSVERIRWCGAGTRLRCAMEESCW